MNPLRFGLTLALAACCLPATAQVPAMAGAPSDRPLPPEPGQAPTGVQAGADLPQADVLTLSEQRELGMIRQNVGTDLDRLDRDYVTIEARSSEIDPAVWGMLEQSRTNARARYSGLAEADLQAFHADRAALMTDYGAYNTAITRARLSMADERAYGQMVGERMDWYGRELNRMSARMSALPENQRAEHAVEMIRLRRQHDALALQHRRLNRAPMVERDAMRRQLTDDLARFDTTVRTSTLGWDWSAGN